MDQSFTFTTLADRPELLEAACAMPAGSEGQNRYMLEELEASEKLWPLCYLLVADGRVVARCVMRDGFLSELTFGDIPVEAAVGFLREIIRRHRGEALETHLYSDKTNHILMYHSLAAAGFDPAIQKESYVGKPGTQTAGPLNFGTPDKELLYRLVLQVYQNNLDRGVQKDARTLGAEKAAYKQMKELCGDGRPELVSIGYRDDTPVGFVGVNDFGGGWGAVSYIGVVPEHRGKRYATHLLRHALTLAHDVAIVNLIADIDCQNSPMRAALLETGFDLSTTETVFYYAL